MSSETRDGTRAGRAVASGGRVRGRAAVPGSKSATHRCLNLGLLAGRPMRVVNPLVAEDTELFAAALERLGWRVERESGATGGGAGSIAWNLAPGALPAKATIECGNAGTMFRFLAASLTTIPGSWTLDGVPRLRERPVGPLLVALRTLGARIDCLERDGHAPLRIAGGSLDGGATRLDAGESSQYVSALLMAGLRARRPLAIETTALTSEPYVDLTLQAIAAFGAAAERAGGRFMVEPRADFGAAEARVEGDWSAACYPAAAAALAGAIELVGMRRDSAQGDRRFLELLAAMGAEVEWHGDVVRVGSAPLVAIDADLGSLPDQVPTLAALAPFARGTTVIRNVAHLRIKESDRLDAMARGLRALGAAVEERNDGLSIPGVWAASPPPSNPVQIEARGDHRIAMSFALVGLRRPGIVIDHPEVVSKSFPGFWRALDGWLGGRLPT
jgi:3-phosphoshikimate 1-carboxyvinyltransferase